MLVSQETFYGLFIEKEKEIKGKPGSHERWQFHDNSVQEKATLFPGEASANTLLSSSDMDSAPLG